MRKLLFILITLFLLLCKDASQSKDDSDSILANLGLLSQRSNRLTISGTAVKGIIKNATVTINPLSKDGSCNTSVVLATETTDETGNYSVAYNKTGAIVCLTISSNANGLTTLFDEKANLDVGVPSASNFKMITILPETKIISNAKKNAMISPFSKMIAKRLQYLIKQAGDGADSNKLYAKASKEIVIRFGLQKGLSVASTKEILNPKSAISASISDASYPELDDLLLELENPSSPLTAKFISILVGFSQLANKHKKGGQVDIDDIDAMIEAFAADFEDGLFDGKTPDGKAITFGTGVNQLTFSATPLTTTLLPAIVTYIQEGGKLTVGKPATSTAIITAAQITSQVAFVDNTAIVSASDSNTMTYAGSPFTFIQNAPIATLTPVIANPATSCSSSPALPTGLSLSASCVITGTPTVVQAISNYSITAVTSAGNASSTIAISVIIAPASTLMKTGLAICYTGNTGTTATCDASHLGQDGYEVKGVARSFTGPTQHGTFTSDYTTTDSFGRVWKACLEGRSGATCATGTTTAMDHATAVTACITLNSLNAASGYAGRTDWRLPSIQELKYQTDYGFTNPSVNQTFFPNNSVGGQYVWTATDLASNAASAWTIRQGAYGELLTSTKVTATLNTRCVSGTSGWPGQSFTDNGDGTIKDNVTNLTWQKCMNGLSGVTCATGSITPLDWAASLTYCNTLSLGGKVWRLANLNELSSLVDYTKATSPVINTIFFPGTPVGDTNSSTTNITGGTVPYSVNFSAGSANYNSAKSTAIQHRCVSGN